MSAYKCLCTQNRNLMKIYQHGDISVYVKLGKDLNTNYYEYVMPLKQSGIWHQDT